MTKSNTAPPSRLHWKWRWTPETIVSTMVAFLMTKDNEAHTTKGHPCYAVFVLGQRPKAKEKSCQQPHLSGVGASGESCLMHSWAAYGTSFLPSGERSRHAQDEACGASALGYEGKELFA